MKVKFIDRADINDKRWNGRVHFALGAMPYAYTWYLDNVCEEWNGLILGDYKAVMPVIHGKKWGVPYVYQPFFIQKLGIFADTPITATLSQAFFDTLSSRYRYIEMCIHENSIVPSGFEVQERKNYLLPLKDSYEDMSNKYSNNLQRSLKKAEKNNLVFITQLKPETFVDFYLEHTAPKIKEFEKGYKYTMLRFIHKAIYYGAGMLCAVVNEEKQIIAANFLLTHPTRTINLLPASNAEGRKKGAMHLLIDALIEKNAGSHKYFDFEGSMVEGIASFYKSFGAEEVNYTHIKKNNLPYLMQIFKK